MGFQRVWDEFCPHVWDKWESDGATWVIRDLPPQDDDEAVQIMLETFCLDETLSVVNDVMNDTESMQSIREFFKWGVSKRTSLACYEERDGISKLVGLNVCVVHCRDDTLSDEIAIEGKAWNNIYDAYKMSAETFDVFQYLETDKMLYGVGLLVKREYRGKKLASRILLARTPLSKHLGISGSATFFTSDASRRSAELAGFNTVATITFKDLAAFGLDYIQDDRLAMKYMVKKIV